MSKKVWLASAAIVAVGVCLLMLLAYGYQPSAAERTSDYYEEKNFDVVDTEHFRFSSRQMGRGQPVVLIHGAGTWSYSFRHNASVLASRHAVYSFDMPGHGYTRVKQSPPHYDLEYMSGAIEEYLDAMHLEKVSLVGHSFGGGWALYFAQQHPERVNNLVLMAPRALDVPYKWEWQLMKYPPLGELFSRFFSRNDVRRALEEAYFNDSAVTDDVVDNVFIPLTFPENRRAQYRLVRDSDWTLTERGMAELDVPTLILWGKADNFLSVSQLATFKARMPNLATQVFDHCGHVLHVECARRVNLVLERFLIQ